MAPIHPKRLLESRVRFARDSEASGHDDIADGFERAEEFMSFLSKADSGLLSGGGQSLTYLQAVSELSGASAEIGDSVAIRRSDLFRG